MASVDEFWLENPFLHDYLCDQKKKGGRKSEHIMGASVFIVIFPSLILFKIFLTKAGIK
jgi:hypothetical protein